MRINSSDPDLETIYNRILRGDISFPIGRSRSNKWSEPKRQKLIDTILRGWYIPPIILIEDNISEAVEVLDGYQRLSAITDFINGWLVVDGSVGPKNSFKKYDGLTFGELSESLKNRIYSFSLNCLVISDFSAGEPGELVARLNDRTSLVGAEQRSLSFGRVRSQIKYFVDLLDQYGLGKDFFGFSNARMAYDDVLARVAITIEEGGFKHKLTSEGLMEWYSSDNPLSEFTVDTLHYLVSQLHGVSSIGLVPKFNRATLISWLMFVSRAHANDLYMVDTIVIHDFMNYFERRIVARSNSSTYFSDSVHSSMLLNMYLSRSKTKVDDVSSLVLRDAAIWVMFYQYLMDGGMVSNFYMPGFDEMFNSVVESVDFFGTEEEVSTAILSSGWGALICL